MEECRGAFGNLEDGDVGYVDIVTGVVLVNAGFIFISFVVPDANVREGGDNMVTGEGDAVRAYKETIAYYLVIVVENGNNRSSDVVYLLVEHRLWVIRLREWVIRISGLDI